MEEDILIQPGHMAKALQNEMAPATRPKALRKLRQRFCNACFSLRPGGGYNGRAVALARASACVSHNHPEGIKGAEAVSAAIFMAKCHESKEEIRRYISEH